MAIVAELNSRQDIDGILVQMPLPKQIDSRLILETVASDKDADGFHPTNVGHLVAGRPGPRACTPAGVMEMLRRYGIDPACQINAVTATASIPLARLTP